MPRKQAEEEPAIKPSLAITMGDPAGIGPEVVVKTLSDSGIYKVCRPFVVGDGSLLARTAETLGLPDPFHGAPSNAILLDQANVPRRLKQGRPSLQAGRAAARYVEVAANLALSGTVYGIVTAPINKRALALAGLQEWGHTELLARLSSADRVGMMFWSPRLSVALLTIHLPLEEAIRRITRSEVRKQIQFVDREWKRLFDGPVRIAVAGLNPHAGEMGLFGETELHEIVPAVKAARRRGIRVSGPYPADTVFRRTAAGEFDLVLALYHDQGLIPVKLLDPQRAVNVTLGLPFIRTSVDHGTAYDIAGQGIADPTNLIEAVRLAARLAVNARKL